MSAHPSTFEITDHALIATISALFNVTILLVFMLMNLLNTDKKLLFGLCLVFLGTFANAVPNIIYGGMPFSESGAQRAGISVQDLSGIPGHLPMADQPILLVLMSDIIPLPLLGMVASFGDISLLAGVIIVLARGLSHQYSNANPATDEHSLQPDSGRSEFDLDSTDQAKQWIRPIVHNGQSFHNSNAKRST